MIYGFDVLGDPRAGWLGNAPTPFKVTAKKPIPAPAIVADGKEHVWRGVSDDNKYQPVPEVRCDGTSCGERGTGFFFSGCVVMEAIRRFWNTHPRLFFEGERERTVEHKALPDFDDNALVGTNRHIPADFRNDLSVLNAEKRRFILYYWFATNIFGARTRIRLPVCVVSAVRSKYPNLKGIEYVGHIEIE